MAHHTTTLPLTPSLPVPVPLPLPRSWKLAAGLLKKHTRLDPLQYQKRLRSQWTSRLTKLNRST